MSRPVTGTVEERSATAPVVTDGPRLRGVIPYNVTSVDMGGWSEVIDPGALADTDFSDLVANVDHAGLPLGRHPETLALDDQPDGMHWTCDLPESRTDVREAVQRGDLRCGSWRMIVDADEWAGDVRHVKSVAALLDVSLTTQPAFPAAIVEYRTHNPATGQEEVMAEPAAAPSTTPPVTPVVEERTTPPASPGLHVEDRVTVTAQRPRGLAEEFRNAGFPGETATLPFSRFAENRAVTWTPSVDAINAVQTFAGPLGADQRFAWPVFPQVNVESGATSVDVFTQTARSLATPANVVRAIDAVTAKPETGSTLDIVTTALKQVASICTNVPNVHLEQPAFNTAIETDLRLAINGGLDKLVLDAIVTSGFQAPGTDVLLVSIRKAITTIQASGYNPDTLILPPVSAQALDVPVTGIASGVNDFVFTPGQVAPSSIYGLNVRISKDIPAAAVVDSTALGKLYASPVTLARFEADGGTTNRGNVRMELSAVFGTERTAASVRIAAA